MEANGRVVKVPFTVRDEHSDEEVHAVYCAEDVVVPPRQACMLKGIVGTARQKVSTSSHKAWLVESRSEQQQEQLERSAEEAIARLESMYENAKHAVQRRQRLPGQKCRPGAREQTQGSSWGRQGAVGAEEQMQKEYLNTLMDPIGAGTVDCVTAAKWDEECNRAVVPISGVNMESTPRMSPWCSGQAKGLQTAQNCTAAPSTT